MAISYANTNNFIRWAQMPEGTTLADLQANGLDGYQVDPNANKCGIQANITIDHVAGEATIIVVFTEGTFDTEITVTDKEGVTVAGFGWLVARAMTAILPAGDYIAKIRRASNPVCATERPFTIKEVCGIRIDVYQNGTHVIIQHSYPPDVVFDTEYKLEKLVGKIYEVLSGHDWEVMDRKDIAILDDGYYRASVRKVGTITCASVRIFKLSNAYVSLSGFSIHHGTVVDSDVWSPLFTLTNNSGADKQVIFEIDTTIGAANISIEKNGVISLYPGLTAWDIPASTSLIFRVKFNNFTGVQQYPVISLQDQNPQSTGIQVVTGQLTEFVKRPKITLRINPNT